MKILVAGAGMMGSAAVHDLAGSPAVEKIVVADIKKDLATCVASTYGTRVEPRSLDINYFDDVVELMGTVDAAIGATSYSHNVLLTRAAIEAKTHFCDLGGNMEVVGKQIALGAQAAAAGVLILPNCGLAPGMACVVAAGAAQKFSELRELHIRVGGLPQHPQPPLNYQLVFSPEGLINEYIEPAEVIRGGMRQQVPSMGELEELEFPKPFGKLEAFTTSGGTSTLTRMFEGKIRELDYKTIRYRGHCDKFRTLLDLGFAGQEPITTGSSVFTAREYFEMMLRKRLPVNEPDVVLVRVTIRGVTGGEGRTLVYELTDRYDEAAGMTAMMRTTAFPTSIIAQMAAGGTITARGVLPPEQCVPLEPFLAELKKRKIVFKETSTKILSFGEL